MRQGESKLSDAIREAIAQLPGVVLWRNSPTLARVRGGRAWCGLPRGSADLVGLVEVKVNPATIGRFLALEVKIPGQIPMPEDIARIVTKLGPGWLERDEPWTLGNLWEHAIAKLTEEDRHVMQQEAWLDGVRKLGGFAVYVDSVEAALSAVSFAREPRATLARWRAVSRPRPELDIRFT